MTNAQRLVGAFGIGLVLGGIAWVDNATYGNWAARILPGVGMVVIGVVLVIVALRKGTNLKGVSAFVRMGKGANLKKSTIAKNRSSADDFVDLGDDSTIEETEIVDNIHDPGENPDDD